MNIEPHKNKLLLIAFFIVVFLCLLAGIYVDRRRGEASEVSFTDPVAQDIFADISGAVVSPGVYKLPPGSRVTDLIKICGGVLDNVSIEWLSKNLNLADKLSDAQKVYIPFDWEVQKYTSFELLSLEAPQAASKPGEKAASAVEGDYVNVNSATQKKLEGLPGIGEVTAKRIIDNRPYEDMQILTEKASLSESVAEKIKALVVF